MKQDWRAVYSNHYQITEEWSRTCVSTLLLGGYVSGKNVAEPACEAEVWYDLRAAEVIPAALVDSAVCSTTMGSKTEAPL